MIENIIHEGWLILKRVFFRRKWYEVVVVKPSISCLIYDQTSDSVVFVRQQRPAMVTEGNPEGWTTELPAGRFDRAATAKALIVAEALEEAGIALKEEYIFFLNNEGALAQSSGESTGKIVLTYAEITDDQIDHSQTTFGDPEVGEYTERIMVPVSELAEMTFNCLVSFASVQWFLRTRKGK